MEAVYKQVIEALAARGIRADFHRPHQLALPSRVWISWNSQWFISTWVPACYPVPTEADVVALCEECLRWPNGPFYTIPEEIANRYGLHRMSNEEFDRVILIPPDEDDDGDDES